MTRTLKFTGNGDLRLNVRAPYGRVRVRITEPSGAAIPGYDLTDCVPFAGDDLICSPQWSSGKRIADLDKSQRYHIDVELVCAELYAIRGDFQLHYGRGQEDAQAVYLL